jgi:hypothetical protein
MRVTRERRHDQRTRAINQEVLGTIEAWLPEDAVVATDTSFAGLHFLNPAQLTAVVEVVPGPVTSYGTVGRLVELVRGMSKQPLVLRRDAPGFIWNRIQFAVLRECLQSSTREWQTPLRSTRPSRTGSPRAGSPQGRSRPSISAGSTRSSAVD